MNKAIAWLILFVLSMAGSSCQTPGTTSATGGTEKPIADIAAYQNRAQTAAEGFKRSHTTADQTYISVRSKYKDAAAKNHGYLVAVQAGILKHVKNFDTPAYRSIAADAGSATKDFVDLAEKSTPAGVTAMGFGIGVAEIGDVLIKAGIAIWKAHREDQAAQAKEVVALLKESEWPAWESLGTAAGTKKKSKDAHAKKTENPE
jgi:hypothetical protein